MIEDKAGRRVVSTGSMYFHLDCSEGCSVQVVDEEFVADLFHEADETSRQTERKRVNRKKRR